MHQPLVGKNVVAMLENLQGYEILLASNSPRRKELLQQLGIPFRIHVVPDIDESYPHNLAASDVAQYITRKKSQAYLSGLQANQLLIVADTVVRIDNKVLGKPKSREEACAMLRLLSGKRHIVTTAFGVFTTDQSQVKSCDTEVEFAELSEEIIQFYVDKFQPFDKAGSYGIQEWIGAIGIVGIHGSYVNVMGLPVQSLFEVLQKFSHNKLTESYV